MTEKLKDFTEKLIKVFAEKTSCSEQYGGCPCNTCFHSIEEGNWQHICWLILLGLRGDYDAKDITEDIKLELHL